MMKFGNAAWGFRETPLETQLEITAQMGLGFLELGIANAPADVPLDVNESRITEIKRLSEMYGVKILHAATGNDFTAGSGDIDKVRRVIDICRLLEVKYLRIFAGFTPLAAMEEKTYSEMLASLDAVCRYATDNGVVPAIETHGAVRQYSDGVEHIMSVTTDEYKLKWIISALPDNAGICFDPANLYAVGVKSPDSFYREIEDKVAYAHFKDFIQLPSGHITPSYCGSSDMDWNAVLTAMSSFCGTVFFEYENTEDIKDGLEKSYKFIKENLHNE